ncbi:MAG: ribonuclease III domain-containing protein [Planctomycetota bacterium]
MLRRGHVAGSAAPAGSLADCLPLFHDSSLLELALTHASTEGRGHNERMEFLGDTVLDLIVAESLYRAYPDRPEGDLTQMKAHLVSRATLAEVARELELHLAAQIGGGLKATQLLPRGAREPVRGGCWR